MPEQTCRLARKLRELSLASLAPNDIQFPRIDPSVRERQHLAGMDEFSVRLRATKVQLSYGLEDDRIQPIITFLAFQEGETDLDGLSCLIAYDKLAQIDGPKQIALQSAMMIASHTRQSAHEERTC
ncbi:hypothetical protein [Bradyrhizobium tropiciagri]|uniref:hypothetical protein n=1 Tax=Bradyrhizobium tropiciagri TaxID=312253 RepID=UPI00067B29BD|nr:hypothetical protein [Bradyrhizobium tropiciagri]